MGERMQFAKLDNATCYNRCGNCMEPYRAHRPRMSAPPTCPKGGVYREATEEELDAAYRAKFGDGPPEPIATFNLNNPADMERAKSALSPENLNKFFGIGGRGLAAFEHALRGKASAPRCSMGVGCDEYGVCYAEAHGQPEMCPHAQGMETRQGGNAVPSRSDDSPVGATDAP